MNFQTRIFVAVALCAVIFMLFDFLNPKPPPEEATDGTAVVDAEGKAVVDAEGKGSSEGKGEGKAGAEAQGEGEAEVDPAAAAVEVLEADHEVHDELLALGMTNRSPGRGGLVSQVHLLSPQFAGHATATDAYGLAGKRTLEVTLTDEDGNTLVPRGTPYEVVERTDDRFVVAHRSAELEVIERFVLVHD